MAVVPMQKVAVLAHKPLQEEALKLLQEEGVMEIIAGAHGARIDHTEVDYKKAEVAYARDVLSRHASRQTIEDMQYPGSEHEIERAAMHTDIRGIIDRLKEIEAEKQLLAEKKAAAAETETLLRPWKYYPYKEEEAKGGSAYVDVVPGTLPHDKIDPLKRALQEELPRTDILVLPGEDERRAGIVAHVWKQDRARFEEIATTLGWTEELLSMENGKTVAERLEENMMALREIEQREDVLNKELNAMSKELPNIVRLQIYLQWLDTKQQAREALMTSRDTVTLLGWIPRDHVRTLEAKLQTLSASTALFKIKPDEGEEAPVLLKNPKIFTPFQSVTNLYGLPLSTELDPTVPLSPFFILYFALCLTDAGYGLVLALLFGGLVWKKKYSVADQPLLWLLFMSGIITIIAGMLFGGWFGLTPEQVPEWLTYVTAEGERLFLGQVWNLGAETGIAFLQYLSLALGITHLFFGMFLAGYHKWLHGQKRAALWADFTPHLFLASILFFFFAPATYTDIAQILLGIALVLLVWGKGYGSPWFLRPFAGLLGTINLAIAMLSNTLSYLRILALGLVTGAIALAVNQVAVEMGRLFPVWIGIPVVILIFLGGHLVSIALNSLGSFIHSGRLQFIEFFSQFFEGGGRAFNPFKRVISR